ncbi:acetoacetyl-CoA synthetase [Trichonephila inaurata madagascariensis]|uniref:Acetoacetyl-CoA synthetase n=1 Tax=Trichonephila inaurata madagascariensis TaxID=2747483 RepID=A0A8X7CRN0_9ARAC|nr:acetoacetyl-CoA synthetase [Trichonephila inaurata madagascariensis]
MPVTVHNPSIISELSPDILTGKSKNLKQARIESNHLVWNKKVPDTELEKFKKIIEEKYNLKFETYWDLHSWSVTNFPNFWEEVWNYMGIVTSKPHDEVFSKSGPGFLDNQWFKGAAFNYAENILRIRDNREALLCLDEEGNFEKVTFAEMFQEVKLYAAAFRKHGLQKGDTVACYMSNRKEAIYAMLAATSIGAIWGGPQPFFGARAASNIVARLGAKFLIACDGYVDYGEEHSIMENLPFIAEHAPSLEKIIIVPTKKETLSKDISYIPNSCFLGPFLESGKTPNGEVPDIVFEQLPFDHPVSVAFTSGTTGLPKGAVHSAGSLLGPLMHFALHYNLKSGDVVHTIYPNGWTLWNYHVPCLSLGIKLLLENGTVYRLKDGSNLWDVLSKYKVAYSFLVTSIVDKLEKMKACPDPSNTNFEHLKAITIGGSPVKTENFKYIQSIVKDNVVIAGLYGATETFGPFSGCDFNLPIYAPEIQVPSLGTKAQCVDSNGHPVVGREGELVLTVPNPVLPIYLWKDENNEILKKTYLTKYPGYWCQHDVCYVNPQTNGMVLKGRSDDVLIQKGERFGAADVYFAIHGMEEIQDYICVGQNKFNGDSRAVLFVKMREGYAFTPEFKDKLVNKINGELWEDCVPELILEVQDIPYNVNNKRMESTVRDIVETNRIPITGNVKNPECLKYYCNLPEIVNYNRE